MKKPQINRGSPHGVMVKAFGCKIVVRKFDLPSGYYVYFGTSTIEKGMNPLILPSMGLIVPLLSY